MFIEEACVHQITSSNLDLAVDFWLKSSFLWRIRVALQEAACDVESVEIFSRGFLMEELLWIPVDPLFIMNPLVLVFLLVMAAKSHLMRPLARSKPQDYRAVGDKEDLVIKGYGAGGDYFNLIGDDNNLCRIYEACAVTGSKR